MEEKLRLLEKTVCGEGLEKTVCGEGRNTPEAAEDTAALTNSDHYGDLGMPDILPMMDQEPRAQDVYEAEVANASTVIADNAQSPMQGPVISPRPASDQNPTFGQQLTTLSLEATAERHLGSTTGLSFAKLTQMILRRLTPDHVDFVFNNHSQDNSADTNPWDLNFLADPFNDSFFQSLSESFSVHPLLFGDLFPPEFVGPDATLDSLAWPIDEMHERELVDFYFAHSHTLYPIVKRSEVMGTLEKIRHNPQNLAAQAPFDIFRVWMILAIGSTAYSSVNLTEESESMLFYNKALQYSEQALGNDEMVGTPVHSFDARSVQLTRA